MWVRFCGDYEYRQPSFTIDYKAGTECNVTRNCAEMAVASGKAVRLLKSRRDEDPTEWPTDREPAP
ncbi:hypothetical protein X757_08985 [Mesorhizobium sp. LSHC414A00]|nr:hypothetical protein X757_08985 [Mesorhizobium sp. LSHC414A00]